MDDNGLFNWVASYQKHCLHCGNFSQWYNHPIAAEVCLVHKPDCAALLVQACVAAESRDG